MSFWHQINCALLATMYIDHGPQIHIMDYNAIMDIYIRLNTIPAILVYVSRYMENYYYVWVHYLLHCHLVVVSRFKTYVFEKMTSYYVLNRMSHRSSTIYNNNN